MNASASRAIDRASRGYDANAAFQTAVGEDLLQRLSLARLEPARILDLGAGTGQATIQLKNRYPQAQVLALDRSTGMLAQARRRQTWRRKFMRVCGDAQTLPLADASIDLIHSNLMLQSCDPDAVLSECRRVLRPGGLLTASSLGPDTLRELRTAWAEVDHAAGDRLPVFVDMHDLGDAMTRAGFAAPVLDTERYTLHYRDLRSLLRDVRHIGIHPTVGPRRPGLGGRSDFAALERAYEPLRVDARLPATYEVVFANAWSPETRARAPAGGNESVVSLAEVSEALRRARKDRAESGR